jgi:hypothetical protein
MEADIMLHDIDLFFTLTMVFVGLLVMAVWP